MATEVRLSREMRLLDVTMIGVGAMIGAGIFVLTGTAAGVAGPALILVFLLNGVVALLTAMAYAELGSAFHDAGGGYLWVKTSLPNPNGFLSGWMSWFAHAVACSLYALGFGAYFRLVLTSLGVPEFQLGFMTVEKWLAVIACAVFTGINIRGASETGKAGSIVTVGKILVIGGFVAMGLWIMLRRPDWPRAFTPFLDHGWGSVLAAMGLTFIAFEGYEIIAQTSEEVQDPKRSIPRAMFLSLFIVVPIYLLVALVAVGAVTAPEGMRVTAYLGREKELALVAAADQFVRGGGVVLLVGGLLSTLSALNATIYSSSRVAFAMARDANLPSFLGRVHEGRATPHVAILFSAVIIVAMAVTLPLEDVAAAADVMFLLLFVQVNVALIRLRTSRPDLTRGFRVPLMPVVPIAAISIMLVLAAFLAVHYPTAMVAAAVWVAIGIGVYRGYSRRHETAFVERKEWMERIERKEYRVLVTISSPRALESLMQVGIAIARRHHGDLIVLAVAEVPEGERLMAGRRLARQAEPLLEEAASYTQALGVVTYPVVKIARRVSWGIMETAREEGCNFLVVGQPKTQSFLERVFASTAERVFQDAPCQVGVVYGTIRAADVRRIVVPVTGGRNSQLAAALAPAFAEAFGASIQALTVIPQGTAHADAETLESDARETVRAAALAAPLEVLSRRDVGRGLSEAMKKGDLVVIGAPSMGPLAAVLGGTVPAAIVNRGLNAVVVVRDVEQQRVSRFERVFFGRS